ncbi:Uncharacterised protein [Mycobacteroides abscessus subsp. abscessus]|nr:Uncharacterised protein [Mycobacteroides abscessus subsp. abscessus]
MCRISAAISAGPRVGLIPTIVAPARAAPPSQKTKSGTLSNSTPIWKGPSARSFRASAPRAADSSTT